MIDSIAFNNNYNYIVTNDSFIKLTTYMETIMLEAMVQTEKKHYIIIKPIPNYRTIAYKFDSILKYVQTTVIMSYINYVCNLLRSIAKLDIDLINKSISRRAIDDMIYIIYEKYKNKGYLITIKDKQMIIEINYHCEEIMIRIDTQKILNEVCYGLYIDELQWLNTSPIVTKIDIEVQRLTDVRIKRVSPIIVHKSVFTLKCLLNFVSFSTSEIINTKDILSMYLAELISHDDYKHNYTISRNIVKKILDDNITRCLEKGYHIIYA